MSAFGIRDCCLYIVTVEWDQTCGRWVARDEFEREGTRRHTSTWNVLAEREDQAVAETRYHYKDRNPIILRVECIKVNCAVLISQ